MRQPSGSDWLRTGEQAGGFLGRPLSGFVNWVLAGLAAVTGTVGLKKRHAGPE